MANTKLTTFYIVRHGESEANASVNAGKNYVHPPGGAPLTQKGREQAKIRAKNLRHINFDVAYSSDLTRAKQTAEIIVLQKKLAVIATELIKERVYGIYGNKTLDYRKKMQEIIKELSHKEKMQHKLDPSMESYEEAAVRLITFIRELAIVRPGETVLLVSHGTIMRALLMHLGFVTYDELSSHDSVENTGYIKLESDGVDFFLRETVGIHKK